MTKSASPFQQVKAVFSQPGLSRYGALRESLRLLIPYEWRRRGVSLFRSRLGMKTLFSWATSKLAGSPKTLPPKTIFRRGDFYEAVTLLPHLPEKDVKAILNQPVIQTALAKPDVICFSIVDWSFRFQRPQQLMAQFAAHGHRVFYLNVSDFRSPYAQPKFAVQQIKENLYEVRIAARSPLELFQSVIEGKDLELTLDSLDELRQAYNINEAVSYVMIPSWTQTALETKRRWNWQVVYDCMDEWENFPGVKPESLKAEKLLVQNCDLLVVTAQRLFDKWSQPQRPIVLARNAADYDFYARRCLPNNLLDELSGIGHPIIGYYGAIADWFDVDLLAEVAQLRPQYTFILLGGVFDTDVTRLRESPNVRLLGQQPYETMPQYLYHFDACIIPFKINPITEATDPVKLYEYFSGGKPVVSVNLPELKLYQDHIYIAEDAADFATKLDTAVSENDSALTANRKTLASQHTWSARYQSIISTLTGAVPRASIIIVTYNNLTLTKLCLESVFRNTDHPNYEVVVVDNLSSDETAEYLRQMAAIHNNLKILLNNENYGFAKANNQGIEISTGEYLVLLNNDTIVPQGWLSRLLSHLRDSNIGMVGPLTNFVGNEAKIDVPYRTWAEMESFAADLVWERNEQIADIHMLAMFCVAMRRDVFEKIGPLDEQFGIGMFEDDDYSIRIKNVGYRIVCSADAFVHHFGQAAFGKLMRSGHYDRLFDENRQKFESKWKIVWKAHQHATLEFKPHSEKH